MKKKILLFILILVALFISCTRQKSVIEKLDLNEVTKLIKKDSLYESIIQEIEKVREIIDKNIVLKSKFKNLTYKEFLDYNKTLKDSSFIKNIYDKAEAKFNSQIDSLLKIYKDKVDDKMIFYKGQLEKYDPSKYFNVKFNGIDKEYYSSIHEVRQVNVMFKITPLKGPIQGGSFRYRIIPKVTNRPIGSSGCRFSSFTKSPSVYMWEASYDIEDEFENKTTASIKENYDFEYEILTARINGITYSLEDIDIPFYFKLYMRKDSLSKYEYANLISELFNVKSISYYNILNQITDAEKKKINNIAFELEKLIYENEQLKEIDKELFE